MKSLKCIFFIVLLIAPVSLLSQGQPWTYLDIIAGGPSSAIRVPGPVIETGILLSPQIGFGVRWETEPFNSFFHHGFGGHLRLSTQTTENKGWYLNASVGRGYEYRKKHYRIILNNQKPGYLFSDISIGRYINRRIVFSSGVRVVSEYQDVPTRTEQKSSRLLISKFTFMLGRPSTSTSPALKKINRQTYFFGFYSINSRFFDSFRTNGMINMGLGWKILPRMGLGASLVLNEGLGISDFQDGRNLDRFMGLGTHIFLKGESYWGIIEVGAANQIVVGRWNGISRDHFIHQQHTHSTAVYGRMGAGIFLSKNVLAQASFLIAPFVYGDSQFPGRLPARGSGSRFFEEKDIHFSYSDLNLGIGFLID